MNSKKIILPVFILLVLVQIFVPAKMIWDREEIIDTGIEFKFKTAPVDPTDPFRGKYIRLNYDESLVEMESTEEWFRGEKIFVHLATDKEGFAKAMSGSKDRPSDQQAYIEAKVLYGNSINVRDSVRIVRIEYPFDRFYMEESKAYEAELSYNRIQKSDSSATYALISIKNGDAVLRDVLIDGVSISEIVKQRQKENLE